MFQPTMRGATAAVLTQAALTAIGGGSSPAPGAALLAGLLATGAGWGAVAVTTAAVGLAALGQGTLATGLAAAAWATATSDDLRAAAQAGAVGCALSVLLTWALPAPWIPVAAVVMAQAWPIWAAADPQVPLCPRGLPAPLRLRLAAALGDAAQAWAHADERTGRRRLADAGAELVALSWADARLSALHPAPPALAEELARVRERWQQTADVLVRARRAQEFARALPAPVPEGASADLARATEGLERHVHAVCTSRRELDRVQGATGSSVTPSPSRARNTRGEV